MPFNERGEFIRAQSQSTTAAPASRQRQTLFTLENFLMLAMLIGIVVLLVAVAWLVFRYWEWVLIGAIAAITVQIQRWLS